MPRRRPTPSRKPITFRGTALTERQLRRIQGIVRERSSQTRQAIAREVCRTFSWRRPNGIYAIRSVRQLLVRLEQAGHVRLPPPRRGQGRRLQPADLGAVAADRAPEKSVVRQRESRRLVTPSPPGRHPLTVRPIQSQELPAWRAQMERLHYLGDGALVGETMRYVALLDEEPVALLSWGSASLHNGPRDDYVGWDEACRQANLHLVVNNARFLILPEGRRPNLASRVLGANLRRLSRDWEAVYGHPLVLAETFVDTSRFRGTCYRASNWIDVGETKGWAKQGSDYRYHGQPKAVWLYPLARPFEPRLCIAPRTNMPKKKFRHVDVEKLPLRGEGGLFELLVSFNDPRKRRGIRYPIECVLATALCAVLAGARSFAALGDWAEDQDTKTLVRLGSKHGRPPSERTFRRVLGSIDVEELDRCTGTWMAKQMQLQAGAALALDGKTVRGSGDGEQKARHLLSAIVHENGAVVAQTHVESKTNEITQVVPLLEPLNIEGTIVTGDALLTQQSIARYLVEQKGADYVLSVKDNQPTLRQDIEDCFSSLEEDERRCQRAKGKRPGKGAFPPSAQDR